MHDPLIIYTEELDTETKKMVDDYWAHQNGIFTNYAKDLCVKYNMSWALILAQVKKVGAYNKKLNACEDCNTPIFKIIYTRKEHRSYIQDDTRCESCSDIFFQKNKDSPTLEKLRFLDELQPKLDEGIKNKSWIGLNRFEYDLLLEIIQRKERISIFNYAFNEKNDIKVTFLALDKLEKLNLVIMERDFIKGNLVYHFDKHLEDNMDEERLKTFLSHKINDTFSFSLNKLHKDIFNKDADYSGSFILKNDIILKRNIPYKYEAFIQSDGSITFKCAPDDKFSSRSMDDGFGETFYSGNSRHDDNWIHDSDPPF